MFKSVGLLKGRKIARFESFIYTSIHSYIWGAVKGVANLAFKYDCSNPYIVRDMGCC